MISTHAVSNASLAMLLLLTAVFVMVHRAQWRWLSCGPISDQRYDRRVLASIVFVVGVEVAYIVYVIVFIVQHIVPLVWRH